MTKRINKWWGITTAMLYLTLISMGQGCHDADRYVLTSDASVSVDQLFLLTVQGDSVQRADGFSHVRLEAQIMDVSEGGRTILFTTTAGTLRIGERTRTDSLLVETNQQGRATIDLVSPSEPAVAHVMATLEHITPALTQQQNIRFTPVTAEDMLAFDNLPDTVMVASNATTEIRVRIDPNLEGEDRRVTFTTNNGRFQFGSGNGTTRQVLADNNHVAKVTLESPEDGGEVVVTAAVRGFSLEETIRFFVQPSVSFVNPPTSAPADGETVTRFSIRIVSELERAENLNIEFVTTAGILISGDQEGQRLTLMPGAQDTLGILLKSPRQVGTALITASLEGTRSDETSLIFDLAPPDSIFVAIDPQKFQVRPNEQTTLEATLTRRPGRGQVTEGLSVSFFAADSLGASIPNARFFNVTTADANGVATAIFTPDGSPYRGLVTITATYFDARKTVSGTSTVRIVDE